MIQRTEKHFRNYKIIIKSSNELSAFPNNSMYLCVYSNHDSLDKQGKQNQRNWNFNIDNWFKLDFEKKKKTISKDTVRLPSIELPNSLLDFVIFF